MTSLRNQRLRKDALVFGVLGDLDELNAWLGFLAAPGGGVPAMLPGAAADVLQTQLAALMAEVSGYEGHPPTVDALSFLEREIEALSSTAPGGFVNPRGPVHVARTVCRRAERSLVAYAPAHPAIAFLNRVSDYLFLLACASS